MKTTTASAPILWPAKSGVCCRNRIEWEIARAPLFRTRRGSEPLVRYATEAGWTYLPPDEALRLHEGENCPILINGDGRSATTPLLQRLNPGVVTTATKAEEVIRRLLAVHADIEGNREAWEYLKELKTVFVVGQRAVDVVREQEGGNT